MARTRWKKVISNYYVAVDWKVIVVWTMVSINFSSEGGYASEVDRIMREMGFVTALGENDYVFRWEKEEAVTEDDYRQLEAKVIALIDEVQNRLRGHNVMLRFRTIRSF